MSVPAIINDGFLARRMTATGRLESVAPTIGRRGLRWYALRYRRALPADQPQAFHATVAKKDGRGYELPSTRST
jgi:hypothetical protein